MIRRRMVPSILCLLIMSSIVLTACTTAAPPEEFVLKVAYSDERTFNSELANYFYAKFPHYRIEIIPTRDIYGPGKDPEEELLRIVREEQPDVIITDLSLRRLDQEGLLVDLELLMASDGEFSAEGIHPAVLEKIRQESGGDLNGLAMFFQYPIIYYNKGLFEMYGIPLPTNGMTWSEVFMLAERFPKDDDLYGIDYMYPLALITMIAGDYGLHFYDPATDTINVTSEAWYDAVELLVRMYQSGAMKRTVPRPDPNASSEERIRFQDENDAFLSGKAAMKIGEFYYQNTLRHAVRDRGIEEVDWDIISPPVANPNELATSTFRLEHVFAIHNASSKIDEAWEFVKFYNSEQFARTISRTALSVADGVIARQPYVYNPDGKNMDAFYTLSPMAPTNDASIDYELHSTYFAELDGHLSGMIRRQFTLEEGLNRLETLLQQKLDQLLQEEG